MNRFAIALSIIGFTFLSACVTSDPATPAPAPVVVAPAPVVTAPPPGTIAPGTVVVAPAAQAPIVVPTPAIRAGSGLIESITPLPTSAATGSGAFKPQRRIGIKMDDGTLQYVDTAAEGLSIGQRVDLTADGRIKHL
jgi:hypothetical protein